MIKNKLAFVCLMALAATMGCDKKDDPTNETLLPPKPEPINFGSAVFGSVSDNDGNTYKTITVNGATWFAENLKTKKYSNGESILVLTDGSTWMDATVPAVHTFNGNADVKDLFGYIYNSFAKDDARGICPTGWHIPSVNDWNNLATALGGVAVAGDKKKEEGTKHWRTTNASTNSSGFTGIPVGSLHNGVLTDTGTDGYWWSNAANDFWYLTNDQGDLRHKNDAKVHEGLSVRCVKNP